MELMSPAGSFESVIAAVRGGADAVYFGAGDFNARRNAKNLSGEELQEAFRYCRLRGVKTYVTVNTLVSDRELLSARGLIENLRDWGADAIIVQDLGMARMIRALAPDVPIHASTQMTLHNLPGVLAAQKLGFSRVVLSRELSLEQIAFICKRSEIEIEVFCHGALCMCYSGQCYMSSAIGGRSGNRGLCAQPCRMPYSFFGERAGYHLSLKDLSLASHLRELEQAGVACLKIEGRMKRPEYTALVTSIYKRALREGRAPTKEEIQQLSLMFSRSGFTDGYLTGKKGEDMFGVREEQDPKEARALYREVQKIYKSEPEPPSVPVTFSFRARAGEEMTLSCRDGQGNEASFSAPAPEQAISRATTEEEIRDFIGKTGGTVYFAEKIEVNMAPDLRIPVSAVKGLRRQCTQWLDSRRRLPPKRERGDFSPGVKRLPYQGGPGYVFSFLRWSQVTEDILALRPDFVYLPLSQIAEKPEMAKKVLSRGIALAPVLPRIVFDGEWERVLAQLKQCKKLGIEHIVCTNLGQAPLLSPLGFAMHGDFSLNVMNSQSIKELAKLGLCSCTLSFEMNLAQIRDISSSLPCQMIAYGRLPLMITENCVIKKRGRSCSCTTATAAIIDKTGRSFPLMAEEGCRTTIYNAEKLYLADKKAELARLGLRWLRLCFTTENPRECLSVAAAYMEGHGALVPEKITRGLYFRGVQ